MPFTAKDIRFAKKGNSLYVTCLAWPEGDVVIKSLGSADNPEIKIHNISMLGSDEKITWDQHEENLRVSVPVIKPCKYAYVYKISFEEI